MTTIIHIMASGEATTAAGELRQLARELEVLSLDPNDHDLILKARWLAATKPNSRAADEAQLELMDRLEAWSEVDGNE